MGVNYSCPAPSTQVNFNFNTRPGFTSLSGKDFYFEVYLNIENATPVEKHYIASLILPIYLESTSKENINQFLEYYIHNNKMTNIHLFLARDTTTHQPEGLTINIVLKEYFLENDYSIENEYIVVAQMSAVVEKARNKGIYKESSFLEIIFLNKFNLGKNLVFFDTAVSPIVYQKVSKHALLFPNSMMQTPKNLEKFMIKLMDKFEYESVGEENYFIVNDEIVLDSNDKEKWMSNYNNLPRETKYYIDQTKLRDNIGLLYFICGRLIEGNTLGLPAFELELTEDMQPKLLVKEHYFVRPKI